MSKEKIIEKVRKLLSMTKDNGATDNESQVAIVKAQKLLAEHDMSMSDVEIEQQEKEVVKGEASDFKGRMMWFEKRMASIIADNFRCFTYIKQNWYQGGRALIFMGLKEDVELAKEVFTFALDSMKYHANTFCRVYKKENGSLPKGLRNDYYDGFLKGLRDMFEEQKASDEELAMVLVKDALVYEAMDNMTLSKGRASRISTSQSEEAYGKGYEQGKNFSHGTKQIQ